MSNMRTCLIVATASFMLLGCENANTATQTGGGATALETVKDVAANPTEAKKAKTMQLTGTIMYQNFEGGFYGFVAEDGKKYTLTKLAQEHRKNGLIVQIIAEPMEGLETTTQFGELLTVHEIKVLDDSKVQEIPKDNLM